VKIKEIIKIVEEDGWFYVHTKGSHRKFHHLVKKGSVTIAGKPSADIHPEFLIAF
jgi:predicted RNA binding protein YcfA (HicA-like mRNA interferase family)